MKNYIIAFTAAYALFTFTDNYVFKGNKMYDTYVEDHCWFLKTPDKSLPIQENNQVGNVYHRMQGLMEENPDNLRKALEKIRKELADY